MPVAHGPGLVPAGRVQALPPVLPQRLQQPVAGVALAVLLGDHQRPVDQPGQQLQHAVRRARPSGPARRVHRVGRHPLRRRQRPAAGEDGQRGEERAAPARSSRS